MIRAWWSALWPLCAAACTFEVPDAYLGGGAGGPSGPGGSTTSDGGGGGACLAPETTCPNAIGCFDTNDDEQHCGASCEKCKPGGTCIDGICGCELSLAECTNPPGCYDLKSNVDHCGACETSCDGTTEICSESHCCPIGQLFCDDACYPVQSDETHCGDCATMCTEDEECNAGRCDCKPGLHSCPLPAIGCFLDTDNAHCGALCADCGLDRECVAGGCVCTAGLTECNGACVDVTNDADNCGVCDRVCSTPSFPGSVCLASQCSVVPAAVAGFAGAKAIAVDATTTPTTLYAIEPGGTLWRIRDGVPPDTLSSGINPTQGPVTMAASGGLLAYGMSYQDSPLTLGTWTTLVQHPNNPAGYPAMTFIDGDLYWTSGNCVRRNAPAFFDLHCFTSNPVAFPSAIVERPGDPGFALVLPVFQGSTSGQVRRLSLTVDSLTDTFTNFPIPDKAHDSPRAIVTNATGTAFYFFAYEANTTQYELLRYDFATTTNQVIATFADSVRGVALLRDGGELWWVIQDGASGGALVMHAPLSVLDATTMANPAAIKVRAAVLVPNGPGQLHDVAQDSEGIYFNNSGTVYRLTK